MERDQTPAVETALLKQNCLFRISTDSAQVCWSMGAADHPDPKMEFAVTHNGETWWLMQFWLHRWHISSAPKDLGSLWNSDTDVEFPLCFFCCCWHHASASPSFFSVSVSLLSLPALPVFISYSLSFILRFRRASAFSSRFLTYDYILIPPNSPWRTTTTCLFVTNHSTIPLVQLGVCALQFARWLAHFSSIFSSVILHILWLNVKREPVLCRNSPFQPIFLRVKYVFTLLLHTSCTPQIRGCVTVALEKINEATERCFTMSREHTTGTDILGLRKPLLAVCC